jgi:hypothetical protein
MIILSLFQFVCSLIRLHPGCIVYDRVLNNDRPPSLPLAEQLNKTFPDAAPIDGNAFVHSDRVHVGDSTGSPPTKEPETYMAKLC